MPDGSHFADVVFFIFNQTGAENVRNRGKKQLMSMTNIRAVTPYWWGTEALMSDWYRIGMPETVNLRNDEQTHKLRL